MGHRAIAFANQKGGVAKTTTAHALGRALADRGHGVLLVDLDPQACLTYSAGEDPEALELSLHDVLLGRATIDDVLLDAEHPNLVPATIDMAGAEVHLMGKTGREYVLREALRSVVDDYDYVLIDCPPSLGLLTINGLTAAGEVAIPLQCDTLGHRGVGQLLQTVADVRAYTNPALRILGAVATLYDRRTRLAAEVLGAVETTYGLEVLPPPIPKTVRVAEAPARGRSILEHAPRSTAAAAYRELALTVEARA